MNCFNSRILNILIVFMLLFTPGVSAQFFIFENPLIGEEAPDFQAETLYSGTMTMTEYRQGESAILFFWATWCPHCRTQLKELNAIKDELSEKGIKVILVDLQEPAKKVEGYMKKNKIDFDVFLDKDQSISEEYAIVGVPTFFFIDKDGIIRGVEHEIPSNYEDILKEG